MNPIIKVCGMKYADNIRAILACQPDWMGFIFYNQSPRSISGIPSIISFGETKKVGVFVNEKIEKTEELIKLNELDLVQLHGEESPDYCSRLKQQVKVIKAIPVKHESDLEQMKLYEHSVDYFLFDTKSSTAKGGTGEQFNWSVLKKATINKPFLLSGGLSLEDVDELNNFSHEKLIGYDINSRFESEPGRKEVQLVEDFITKMRRE